MKTSRQMNKYLKSKKKKKKKIERKVVLLKCMYTISGFLANVSVITPEKKYFIYLNESPLKMMKIAFHFTLNALFVLKIFKFFS